MNRNTIALGALALSLLTAPIIAVADHHKDMDHHDGDMGAHHESDRKQDPVQHAEKHLKGLEQKLNLTAEQRPAWQTYSDAVRAQARDKASRMEEFHAKRGEMRGMDTASKMERMSQWMRERADRLEQMAKETRTFQESLTAEQQAVFDTYWEKHARRGMRHDR